MVDVSAAAPGGVDIGGWDFLLEDLPTATDYDFDAFDAAGTADPRFQTPGSGNNSVSFVVRENNIVPEPLTGGLSAMGLMTLAGVMTRRRSNA
jgi:hypothetical protein